MTITNNPDDVVRIKTDLVEITYLNFDLNFEMNESNKIIGYKVALDIKSHRPCILILQLFSDSRITIPIHLYSRITSFKCRTDKAMVIGAYKIITNKNGQKLIPYGKQGFRFISIFAKSHRAKYVLGKKVVSDSFDDNELVECTHGIHFFPTKEQALAYFNFQKDWIHRLFF